MSRVTNIDDNRPHITIQGLNRDVHVIPVSFFQDVVAGKLSLKDLGQFDNIVPVIIGQWLLDHSGNISSPDARIAVLKNALNELLNDCINFDGGKLTDRIMQQASEVLKNDDPNRQ